MRHFITIYIQIIQILPHVKGNNSINKQILNSNIILQMYWQLDIDKAKHRLSHTHIVKLSRRSCGLYQSQNHSGACRVLSRWGYGVYKGFCLYNTA